MQKRPATHSIRKIQFTNLPVYIYAHYIHPQQHPRHQADEIAEEHHLAVDPGGRGIGPVGGHHLQRLVGDIEFDIALDVPRYLVLELFEIASRVLPKGMARRMSPIR